MNQTSTSPSRGTLQAPLRRSAASHASIRESNMTLVADELFAVGGGLSRAELAARTGLTRATVSRLVSDLIERGIVAEAAPSESERAGRPATPLYPASRTVVGVGLEVNVDRMSGCAIDLAGEVVASFHQEIDLVDSDSSQALRELSAKTAVLLSQVKALGVSRIAGAYLGIPGIVDAATDRVVNAPNLGWSSVYPAEFLGTVIGANVPFEVDNDANLQALAVAAWGTQSQERWPDSFLYLTGDIGIGGSIIAGGQADKGPHGRAGEIGHMTIEPSGPPCHCGSSGCLERYAGKRAILTAAELPVGATTEELLAALDRGESKALVAVRRAGWALGIAIANVVNLLDLDHIVLGTSLAPLLPWLRPSLNGELDRRIIARSSADVTILGAPIGEHPAAQGGALLALQKVLEPTMAE